MQSLHNADLFALWALYGGSHGRWTGAMIALTALGSGWVSILLLPMLAWRRTRRFAVPLTAAILATAVVVWGAKLAVGRVRPWIAFGLPAPVAAPRDFSFPSGHAAGSFCVAVYLSLVVASLVPGRPWLCRALAALALVLAALIAVSRVYLGAHFPSDAAAGSLVGVFAGGLAARRYHRRARAAPPQATP